MNYQRDDDHSGRELMRVLTGYADVIIGVGVTVFFFLRGNEQLSQTAGILTALLAAQKVSIHNEIRRLRAEIVNALAPLHQLQRTLDLEQDSKIAQLDELVKEYLRITDSEFRRVKDNIILGAQEKLSRILHQKVSEELTTSEYYAWVLPMLDGVTAGELVCAVSLMNDAEWDDSEVQQHFLAKNLAAAERGAKVERVFIIPREKFKECLAKEVIRQHQLNAHKGLNGFFVLREDLQSRDPDLYRRLGDGFFKIGDRVALVDRFWRNNAEARGYVTMNSGELHDLSRCFEQIRILSRPLTEASKAPA